MPVSAAMPSSLDGSSPLLDGLTGGRKGTSSRGRKRDFMSAERQRGGVGRGGEGKSVRAKSTRQERARQGDHERRRRRRVEEQGQHAFGHAGRQAGTTEAEGR